MNHLNVFKQCYCSGSWGVKGLHHKIVFFYVLTAFYFNTMLLSVPIVGVCVPFQIGYCCSQL